MTNNNSTKTNTNKKGEIKMTISNIVTEALLKLKEVNPFFKALLNDKNVVYDNKAPEVNTDTKRTIQEDDIAARCSCCNYGIKSTDVINYSKREFGEVLCTKCQEKKRWAKPCVHCGELVHFKSRSEMFDSMNRAKYRGLKYLPYHSKCATEILEKKYSMKLAPEERAEDAIMYCEKKSTMATEGVQLEIDCSELDTSIEECMRKNHLTTDNKQKLVDEIINEQIITSTLTFKPTITPTANM